MIPVMLKLMNVVVYSRVQTTRSVSTPTDFSTVSVIGATSIGLKITRVKVFIPFCDIFHIFHENMCFP